MDTATNTVSNAIVLAAGTNEVAAAAGQTMTLTGIISGTGNLTIDDSTNTGTVVFGQSPSNSNTYSGATTVAYAATG